MLKTEISLIGTTSVIWVGELPPLAIGHLLGINKRGMVIRESIIVLNESGTADGQYLAVEPA